MAYKHTENCQLLSELSSASLEVVLSVAIASFTRKMYPLMPIFNPKKATYSKNLHFLLMRCTEVIGPLFIKQAP